VSSLVVVIVPTCLLSVSDWALSVAGAELPARHIMTFIICLQTSPQNIAVSTQLQHSDWYCLRTVSTLSLHTTFSNVVRWSSSCYWFDAPLTRSWYDMMSQLWFLRLESWSRDVLRLVFNVFVLNIWLLTTSVYDIWPIGGWRSEDITKTSFNETNATNASTTLCPHCITDVCSPSVTDVLGTATGETRWKSVVMHYLHLWKPSTEDIMWNVWYVLALRRVFYFYFYEILVAARLGTCLSS